MKAAFSIISIFSAIFVGLFVIILHKHNEIYSTNFAALNKNCLNEAKTRYSFDCEKILDGDFKAIQHAKRFQIFEVSDIENLNGTNCSDFILENYCKQFHFINRLISKNGY